MSLIDIVRSAWGFSGIAPRRIVDQNAFGNLIVEDNEGRYWRICPEELECEVVASSAGELEDLRATEDFGDDWKMEELVAIAASKLGAPGEGRCYCLKLPGVLGGEYEADNIGTIELGELLEFAGNLAAQIKDLPDGTRIVLEADDDEDGDDDGQDEDEGYDEDDEAYEDDEEYEARRQEMLERLVAAPQKEVLGIVLLGNLHLARESDEEPWMVGVTMTEWKFDAGSLNTTPLELVCEAQDEDLDALETALEANAVIRARARIIHDEETGEYEGLLDELVGSDSDPELQARLGELTKPIVVEDEQLGTLIYDRELEQYDGTLDWNGTPVTLHVAVENPDAHEAGRSVAHALVRDQKLWAQRVADYAAQELLELKNESWLEEEESEATAEDFGARMTLETILVSRDGSFEFWHNDGDLFWGHSIVIAGNLEDGLDDADIPG